MNAPDYRHGYLRVPLAVWLDVYCRAPLTRRQLQLVSVVIRASWGWQTQGDEVYLWTRPFTARRFATLTGLSTDHLARDLHALVARGVLLEKEGRYQFVPDPQRWKVGRLRAMNQPPSALKLPGGDAESALRTPVLKTVNKSQRNVPPPPRGRLSTAGDKSRTPGRSPWMPLSAVADTFVFRDRFLEILEAFVGTLPEEQVERLRSWIHQDGVPAVWRALEGSFRHGPRAVRCRLEGRWAGEGDAPPWPDQASDEEVKDA